MNKPWIKKSTGRLNIKLFWLAAFTFLVILLALLLSYWFFYRNDPKEAANQMYNLCKYNRYKDACYAGNFYTLAKTQRFGFTHRVLTELRGIDNTVSDCHFIAHQIALSEVGNNPKDWMSLFKEFDPEECAGGFLHGVIEGYGRTDPTFIIDMNTLFAVCKEIEKIHSEKGNFEIYRSCVHTMGHLILVQENGDVDRSINICLSVQENSVLACSFGVFMENLQRQNLKAHGIKNSIVFDIETKNEEIQRCGKYSGIVSEACWQNISWFFNRVNNYDQDLLYKDCRNAPTELAAARCYTWGASVIGLYRLSGKVSAKELSGLCDPLKNNKEFFNRCIKGVVNYLLLANHIFIPEVRNFCQSLDEGDKDLCESELDMLPVSGEKFTVGSESEQGVLSSFKLWGVNP